MSEVIDIKVWIRENLIPRRKLDCIIADKVYGLKVIGWAAEDYDYGIIHNPDSKWLAEEKETRCTDPVYIKKCMCDKFDKVFTQDSDRRTRKFFGHYSECMAVIPRFSSKVEDAIDLVEDLRPEVTVVFVSESEGWFVNVCTTLPMGVCYKSRDEKLPVAIVDALMLYLDAHPEFKKKELNHG